MIPLSIVRIVYFAEKNGQKALVNVTIPQSEFLTKNDVEKNAVAYVQQHLSAVFQEYITHKYPTFSFGTFECTLSDPTEIMDCSGITSEFPDADTKEFWHSRWFVMLEAHLTPVTAENCWRFTENYAKKSRSIGTLIGLKGNPLDLNTGLTVVII